jgi:RimJ/RimL family protein N-acetyltransferase
MINWATEKEVENFASLEFRIMNKYDFMKYAEAHNESIESNSKYMDLGYFSVERPLSVLQRNYQESVRDRNIDMYGIFENGRLLGMASYFNTMYSDNGCHVTIWIRASQKNRGLGTYFLKRVSSEGIYEKKFRFIELMIDSQNQPSRRMAEKVGYELIEVMDVPTQGSMGSGQYCRYLLFSPEIDALALNYHKQPIDLIDHPAVRPEYRSLIHSEEINEYLRWPWETLTKREYEGEPFGPVLEELVLEAQLESDYLDSILNADLPVKNRISLSRTPQWNNGLLRNSY